MATKRAFTTLGIPFTEVRVDQDDAARERIVQDGFKQSPVVYVDGLEPWSGFDPLKISAAVSHLGHE